MRGESFSHMEEVIWGFWVNRFHSVVKVNFKDAKGIICNYLERLLLSDPFVMRVNLGMKNAKIFLNY